MPAANATISAPVTVIDTNSASACGGLSHYDALYVDGVHIQDCGYSSCTFSPAGYLAGTIHGIVIYAHTSNLPVTGYICDSSPVTSITIGGSLATATPTPVPTATPTASPTPVPGPTPLPVIINLITPAAGAVISGPTTIVDNSNSSMCGGLDYYDQLYVDGVRAQDCNFSVSGAATPCVLTPAGYTTFSPNIAPLAPGSAHNIKMIAHTSNPNGVMCGESQIVTVSISGTLASPTPTPNPSVVPTPNPTATPRPSTTATPSPVPTPGPGFVAILPAGSRIASLTGSTAAMKSAGITGNYNTATYGQYSGQSNLWGGPLLDDLQAAQMTLTVPYNSVENSSQYGSVNKTADNYYQTVAANDQSGYLAELANYYSTQGNFIAVVANRVDGACPIVNPTAAEAAQWAANKWGLNPAYLYGDACQEGNWDQANPGDPTKCGTNLDMYGGCSAGIWQEADRNGGGSIPDHGWSGLLTNNLAAESVCFNADFYMMTRWAVYNGVWTGEGNYLGNGLATMGAWDYGGGVPTGDGYATSLVNNIANNAWVNSGSQCCITGNCWSSTIAIHPPAGTAVPND